MKIPSFNLIGAGHLGKHIGFALSKNKIAHLLGIYNLHFNRAQSACEQIEQGLPFPRLDLLPPSDVTWITCHDEAIATAVEALCHSPNLKKNSLIIHCSGVLNSSVLLPLKKYGCSIASIHPLKAFKEDHISIDAFRAIDCALEGDQEACAWLEIAFNQLNANVFFIQPELKSSYHAAACIASNHLITLASHAEQLFLQAGIPPNKTQELIGKLMQSNIDNLLKTRSAKDALTGPLARGDIQTIALHLQSIVEPEIATFYKQSALVTLSLTSLPTEKITALKKLLHSDNH